MRWRSASTAASTSSRAARSGIPRRPRARSSRRSSADEAGIGAVRPHLLRQRVGRLGWLPGRPSCRLRARPPLRHRAQERRRRGRRRAVRAGDRRRPRRLRAAAARRRHRARRAQPAALPVRAGSHASGTQAARRDHADAARVAPCAVPARRAGGRGEAGRGARPRRQMRRRPSSTCSSRSGWRRESRPRRARRRRRHRCLAAGARARCRARWRDAGAADRARRCGGSCRRARCRRSCRRARRRSTRLRRMPGRRSSASVAERIGATAVVAPGTGPATDAMARAAVRLGRAARHQRQRRDGGLAALADAPALGREPARGGASCMPVARC